jgi:hypothetical protein
MVSSNNLISSDSYLSKNNNSFEYSLSGYILNKIQINIDDLDSNN